MSELPIIRLEIEGMRHTIVRCLSEKSLGLDTTVQAELERICSNENLERIVRETVGRELRGVLDGVVSDCLRALRYDDVLKRVVRFHLTQGINGGKKRKVKA